MREINPTEQELKDKIYALTAQRDKLPSDADFQAGVRTRRELRDAEADIEDGIADGFAWPRAKTGDSQAAPDPTVKDYVSAVDKLRIVGCEAIRGLQYGTDSLIEEGVSNANRCIHK